MCEISLLPNFMVFSLKHLNTENIITNLLCATLICLISDDISFQTCYLSVELKKLRRRCVCVGGGHFNVKHSNILSMGLQTDVEISEHQTRTSTLQPRGPAQVMFITVTVIGYYGTFMSTLF